MRRPACWRETQLPLTGGGLGFIELLQRPATAWSGAMQPHGIANQYDSSCDRDSWGPAAQHFKSRCELNGYPFGAVPRPRGAFTWSQSPPRPMLTNLPELAGLATTKFTVALWRVCAILTVRRAAGQQPG
jgi:hypothetical protein